MTYITVVFEINGCERARGVTVEGVDLDSAAAREWATELPPDGARIIDVFVSR